MIHDHLFTKGRLPLMNRALDAYAMRQQTIATNMANATSPIYRPQRVKFEEEFEKQQTVLRGTRGDDRHMPVGSLNDSEIKGEGEPSPVPEPERLFSGESHVNVDKEMSELAQNQIRFRFASRMTQKFFQGMQNAIRGSNQ